MPKMVPLIGFLLVLITLQSTPLIAELTKIQHLPKKEGNLAILVIGDFGRKGTYNQSKVATQMGVVGEKLNIDYVISTGDNFYEDGLTGVDDPAFYESFSGIYTADSIKTPWYLILGNHDYRGDVLAQLNPVLREKDNRFICMRSFILNSGIVDFFMVDTPPFELDYWTNPGSSHYDWRDVAPRDTYLSNLLQELDEALKKSTATWKFVVGHHTMRSVSDHGDTPELLQLLLPVLKVNQVDAYINGHDHCLQHISSNDSKLHYITSGGGSKAWRNVLKKNEDTVRFFYDGQGFMSLEVSETKAKFVFYDAFGNVLYKWSTDKATDQLCPSF
ncbi:purple acid phosphatase 3-like protein [Carex littledalei]|uniref:Purple acid phosphatase n=1 Tax=Carex littledalei TaxID=544730 RepID=A0A833QSC8_9POAL|nr:purple acid phosphatase 3-like protein [Carex littledalei]